MLIKIKKPENLKKPYTKKKTIKAQKQKGGAQTSPNLRKPRKQIKNLDVR